MTLVHTSGITYESSSDEKCLYLVPRPLAKLAHMDQEEPSGPQPVDRIATEGVMAAAKGDQVFQPVIAASLPAADVVAFGLAYTLACRHGHTGHFPQYCPDFSRNKPLIFLKLH